MLELLKVDEEFQSKIPPLTDEEFKQLEQNILEDGEVHAPIVVWNGTIIDGHNRWKIIQAHPDIPYKLKDMNFADKWAAFDWMYKNQLGRRNLTDEQRTYLLGKLYEARKHTHGFNSESQERSPDGKFRSMQNAHSGETDKYGRKKRITDYIAEEHGVNSSTVQRAEHYAKGIDIIRKEEPQLADSILTGKTSVPKNEIQALRNASTDETKSAIEAIKNGTVSVNRQKTKEEKAELKDIKRRVEQSRTATTYVPEVKDLIRDLKNNSVPYIRLLNQMIKGYKDVIKGNSDEVLQTIKECIEDEIEKIKEKVRNEYA